MRVASDAICLYRELRWLALVPAVAVAAGLLGLPLLFLLGELGVRGELLAQAAPIALLVPGGLLVLGLVASDWMSRTMAPRSGVVEIGDDGVVVERGGRRVLRTTRPTEGWTRDHFGAVEVVLRAGRGQIVTFTTANAARAAEALATAGITPERSAVKTRLYDVGAWSPLLRARALVLARRWLVAATIAASVALGFAGLPILVPLVLGAVIVAALADNVLETLWPAEVTVGIDGLLVEGMRHRRWLPFGDIATIKKDGGGILVVLDNGERFDLPMPLAPTRMGTRHRWPIGSFAERTHGPAEQRARQTALFQHIERAIEAWRRHGELAGAQLLERRGRPLDRWARELRDLVKNRYRAAGFTAAELADVAADAQEQAERRIGAAVALARIDEADCRTRLRIAVDTCANPELRAALEAAAEDALDEATYARATRAAPP
jgi:hypothetical protein